jgi:predicted dehydrogenase
MDKVGIGVIGCGIGKWHLEGLDEDTRAKVIAVAGPDTERCAMLANEHSVPHVYSDYRELLQRDDIDAVTVAVPNMLHLPIALDAFAAGKHVLMEKPLARTTAEGEQMVAAAKEADRILGIIFNRRARSDMQVLRQHIEAGKMGEIYHAKAYWMRRAGIPGLGSWFTSKNAAGGGPLIDLGVHVLDMALWLMDNPTVVSVSAATYSKLGPQGLGTWSGNRFRQDDAHPYEVEDLAVALLRTEDGSTIYLETSWAAFTHHTDEFGVTLLGTKSGAEIHVKDYVEGRTLQIFGEIGGAPVDSTPRLFPKPPSAGHGEIISHFLDAILLGVPMSPSGEEGLDRTRLIEAIYRSAQEGRELTISPIAQIQGV